MRTIILLRLSQLLLIIPCFLREVLNTITDTGQYNIVLRTTEKIYAFPTPKTAGIVFNRSIHNLSLEKINAILLILSHAFVAIFLLVGLVILFRHIKNPDIKQYNRAKTVCIIGLCLGIFQYVFIYGFFAMDYFLSWMQNLGFNSYIMGYGLPLAIALLFLSLKDFKELQH